MRSLQAFSLTLPALDPSMFLGYPVISCCYQERADIFAFLAPPCFPLALVLGRSPVMLVVARFPGPDSLSDNTVAMRYHYTWLKGLTRPLVPLYAYPHESSISHENTVPVSVADAKYPSNTGSEAFRFGHAASATQRYSCSFSLRLVSSVVSVHVDTSYNGWRKTI